MKDVNKYAEFAERFLSEMGKKGCTATEIESLLGITKQSVSNYTSGKSIPPIDKLHKLADYFDVTLDWLLCRPGAKRAADTDVAYICQYTGLSETAVANIHNNRTSPISKYATKFLESISSVIVFTELGLAEKSINAALSRAEAGETSNIKPFTPEFYTDTDGTIKLIGVNAVTPSAGYNEYKMSCYEAQKYFSSFVDGLFLDKEEKYQKLCGNPLLSTMKRASLEFYTEEDENDGEHHKAQK